MLHQIEGSKAMARAIALCRPQVVCAYPITRIRGALGRHRRLFLAKAVYNAARLGLPIVMTLGNRAIGAPINIWNDHSDATAMRESISRVPARSRALQRRAILKARQCFQEFRRQKTATLASVLGKYYNIYTSCYFGGAVRKFAVGP
jgi:hypothetical protein